MPNNRISAEEFFYSRDTETVRAKDLSENNLYAHAGIIHDLKMMVNYKKTLFAFKDNHGKYIQIVKWSDEQGKVDKLANIQYTSIPVYDLFELLYENDILYNMSVAVAKNKSLKSKDKNSNMKRSIRREKNVKNISGNKVYKKKIDRSQGIKKIINQYEQMDEADFFDLVSIGGLSDYIKLLQNRYYVYIFLEIIYDCRAYRKKLKLFYKIHEKKKKKKKYLNALKTLWEIEYLLSEELKDCLGRVEDILNENITISKKDYQKKIKVSIVQKLKKNGLTDTASNKFYKDLKNTIQ